ncbi:MAG TPA: PAS domain S-box protein [Mucilaginibacter sp.]|jgi:PAS domain S-box-containing protein|nr:PAS domain S-box protein [Mucilaginibacter sp.]
MKNSLKIPLIFLVAGVLWAIFSDPFITFITRKLNPAGQDVYRSLNDFLFVVTIALVLYFLIKAQQRRLIRSEEEYRELFESNPNPMWIYDKNTFGFIKVNDAAVEKYGYSHNQFLKMTILDIQPKNEREQLRAYIRKNQDRLRSSGIRQHIKSNGEPVSVAVVAHPVLFNNRKCGFAMATDMTELLEQDKKLQSAYEKIKASNEVLLQIAWANSHQVRRPLCSVLSLIDLLKQATGEEEKEELLSLLEISSDELDQVIRRNSEKVTEIEAIEA